MYSTLWLTIFRANFMVFMGFVSRCQELRVIAQIAPYSGYIPDSKGLI